MYPRPHDERLLQTILAPTSIETRPYQTRIISKTWHAFREGTRSVLIHSPTGSGKTIMGLLAAKGIQQKKKLRVGWVAMRRNLLTQVQRENSQKLVGVEMSVFSMFDRSPPPDLDMLVVDEAQHDCTASMMTIHNLIRPKFIIGLSATPYRTDKLKLCFEKVIRDAGIHSLIQDGYLSPFDHYTVPVFTPEETTCCYLRDREKWGKSIFYFHTLAECREAAARLKSSGVAVEVVTGSSDRERQLEWFASGKLQVLVNSQVLVEGMDEPTIKTVFVRPSGTAPTIQMAGRVLRKCPELPVKQIVQCQHTRCPMVRTATPLNQYTWTDGRWLSVNANPFLNEISTMAVRAMANIDISLPKFIVMNTKSPRQRLTARGNIPIE